MFHRRFSPTGTEDGQLLRLDASARETLLQILNDVRIGCWRALGEPEDVENAPAGASPRELTYWRLMYLAGYFEMNFVAPEAADEM